MATGPKNRFTRYRGKQRSPTKRQVTVRLDRAKAARTAAEAFVADHEGLGAHDRALAIAVHRATEGTADCKLTGGNGYIAAESSN